MLILQIQWRVSSNTNFNIILRAKHNYTMGQIEFDTCVLDYYATTALALVSDY